METELNENTRRFSVCDPSTARDGIVLTLGLADDDEGEKMESKKRENAK